MDAVIECTRKKNLEIAVAFGILNEAGGAMLDSHGHSLAGKNYLDFGQGADDHLLVISAATKTLARKLSRATIAL